MKPRPRVEATPLVTAGELMHRFIADPRPYDADAVRELASVARIAAATCSACGGRGEVAAIGACPICAPVRNALHALVRL